MSRIIKTGLLSLGLTATMTAGAFAGSCPADKVLKTPRVIEEVTDASKLQADVVNAVDPTGWRGVKGLMLRTRRLTILPGGFVPTHSHEDRPAIIYIISGEIIEHNTTCAVAIVHKAGESTGEFGGTLKHWWENKGKIEVVLTSSDVVPPDQLDGPDM